MKIKALLGFIVFLLFGLTCAYSNVEVFSNYDTVMTIDSNDLIYVNKSLSLKNVYDVGIVPGQIEFKIGRGTQGSVSSIDVLNVSAYDRFGNEIRSQVRQTEGFSVVILDVYYPLLPGFEYEFNLDYTLSYEASGIFFKSLSIPLRESTIPIEEGVFEVNLPNNYYFTFTEDGGTNVSVSENVGRWDIKDNLPEQIEFEYSYIPISLGNLQGSYVFWIAINLLLVLFLIYEVRKEIRRVRREYEK